MSAPRRPLNLHTSLQACRKNLTACYHHAVFCQSVSLALVIPLGFISNFIGRINLFQYQLRETVAEDVESGGTQTQFQHNTKSPEDSSHVVEPPTTEQSANEKILHVKQPPNRISIGFSGIICKVDEDTIVKHPKRNYFILGVDDQSTGAIRLAYAKQGDLERYIQSHDKPCEAIRATWIRSLVETFWYIYSRKVLHQDVKPNNILVENGRLKVADFANAAMYALDADMEEICVKDPLSRVDMLGLGCIIYSIAAWRVFYYDYFEHDRWPEPEELPVTSGLLCEDIINKCWHSGGGRMARLYNILRGELEVPDQY